MHFVENAWLRNRISRKLFKGVGLLVMKKHYGQNSNTVAELIVYSRCLHFQLKRDVDDCVMELERTTFLKRAGAFLKRAGVVFICYGYGYGYGV